MCVFLVAVVVVVAYKLLNFTQFVHMLIVKPNISLTNPI